VSTVTETQAAAPAVTVELTAEGLFHRYSGNRGLRPLSFAVGAPGVVAVTGFNGSGKSTLLRIIAGLLRPSGGRLTLAVGGRRLEPSQRRAAIGLASPELQLYDEFSVAENLRFAVEARGLAGGDAAVVEALRTVGLQSRADDRVTALSSGMKQRLRLASAILHRPPLLLLDEPGSHLDDDGRQVVRELAAEWGRRALVLIATNEESERRLGERRIELVGRGLGDPA
jgi:heme exporter protein A